MLVSPTELRRQCHRSGHPPIIIDARPVEQYRRGHIPGAISVDWTAWCDAAPSPAQRVLRRPGYWGTLAERSTRWYADQLGALGISSEVPIVVYADGPRSKGRDGRVAWMLLYLGAQSVALLNGGWQGWRCIDGTIERSTPPPKLGRFVVNIQTQRRCWPSDLIDRDGPDGRQVLVDTRTLAEFKGRVHPYQPRMGHLPGAVLVPFAELFMPSEMYLDARTYADRIPYQVQRALHLAAYCEVGVRACCFALLHEIHTGRVVQIYDGSMVAWSLDPALPVQLGEAWAQFDLPRRGAIRGILGPWPTSCRRRQKPGVPGRQILPHRNYDQASARCTARPPSRFPWEDLVNAGQQVRNVQSLPVHVHQD